MLKVKLKAALIHACISIAVALLTAAMVYGIWYPGAFAEMSQGAVLYRLVLGVEIVLGPLMSLVVFNPAKSKSELVLDYAVIGGIQFAALIYGLYSVSMSRPVYLVFVKDRIEVVAATELTQDDIIKGAEGFRDLPWFGPHLICVEPPVDPQEKSDLLMSAFGGRDIQLQPKYYRECHDGEIEGRVYSKDQLASLTQVKLESLPGDVAYKSFTWLPVVTRFGAWTVFFKNGDVGKPVYVNVDPFESADAMPDVMDEGKVTPPASTDQ